MNLVKCVVSVALVTAAALGSTTVPCGNPLRSAARSTPPAGQPPARTMQREYPT
jgi:hypothetical protein